VSFRHRSAELPVSLCLGAFYATRWRFRSLRLRATLQHEWASKQTSSATDSWSRSVPIRSAPKRWCALMEAGFLAFIQRIRTSSTRKLKTSGYAPTAPKVLPCIWWKAKWSCRLESTEKSPELFLVTNSWMRALPSRSDQAGFVSLMLGESKRGCAM